ncbi:hypothetical protein AB0C76_19735 [Kitasatospora sp. NPDC048722]|uniref:hypothetical protein n=1 Tax=Kitasatospora sp. NPDC048722 TaxID=3155639 RepID=UPI0033F5D869
MANLISQAGPNHGTGLAWLCAARDQGCRDMTPGSYVVTNLHRDDETPEPVHYRTFWSPSDEQILPHPSTPLNGATNTETSRLKHNDFLADPAVIDAVAGILAPG